MYKLIIVLTLCLVSFDANAGLFTYMQASSALDKCEIQEKIIKEQAYWISQFMNCFINNTVLKENKMRALYEVSPNYERIGKDVVKLLESGIDIRGYEFEPFINITNNTCYEYVVKDRYHKLFNYLKER